MDTSGGIYIAAAILLAAFAAYMSEMRRMTLEEAREYLHMKRSDVSHKLELRSMLMRFEDELCRIERKEDEEYIVGPEQQRAKERYRKFLLSHIEVLKSELSAYTTKTA